MEGATPITDVETAITRMLSSMEKHGKSLTLAFQVIGYFTWVQNGDYHKAYGDFRQYLDEFVYEKTWAELSNGDRKICYGIAISSSSKGSEIREFLEMDHNYFNQCRSSLSKKN